MSTEEVKNVFSRSNIFTTVYFISVPLALIVRYVWGDGLADSHASTSHSLNLYDYDNNSYSCNWYPLHYSLHVAQRSTRSAYIFPNLTKIVTSQYELAIIRYRIKQIYEVEFSFTKSDRLRGLISCSSENKLYYSTTFMTTWSIDGTDSTDNRAFKD